VGWTDFFLDSGYFLARVTIALVLGSVVGAERQWHKRKAGLRTHALVSVGAAMFVAISTAAGDVSPTRIAAQVVSGLGFLGAGVIFREGLNIKGLDTAATIWCSGAVGSLAGMGYLPEATLGAFLVLAANLLLRPITKRIDRSRDDPQSQEEIRYVLSIACRARVIAETRRALRQCVEEQDLTLFALETSLERGPELWMLRAEVGGRNANEGIIEMALDELRNRKGVVTAGWRRPENGESVS
jgi:putative Mg2+ transporter-C (MgtC) family protein